MTEPAREATGETLSASLRTPRAAAVAGMLFCVLYVAAVLCLRLAYPYNAFIDSTFVPDSSNLTFARLGIWIVPFGGIAFLWFIGVIRNHLGASEDRLFSTVFLGSGYLFIVLMFMATAVLAGLMALYGSDLQVGGDTRMLVGTVTDDLFITYGARMAAVFTMAATTMSRRTRVIPTWLVILGYVAGVAMMLAPIGVRYVELLFPIWVGVYSLYVFIRYGGTHEDEFS